MGGPPTPPPPLPHQMILRMHVSFRVCCDGDGALTALRDVWLLQHPTATKIRATLFGDLINRIALFWYQRSWYHILLISCKKQNFLLKEF